MARALIAGAGPVGLTLALELRRYGVPVRIIDRAPEPSDKSRAIVIWPRTLELLERAGVAADLVAAGIRCPANEIYAGREHIARVSFTEIDSAHRFALLIPQSETERILAAKLSALGIGVERGVELRGFTDDGGGVTADLGAAGSARVPWLLGCDGAGSTVRHRLGLDFAGDTLPQSFVLADLHVAGLGDPPDEMVMFWSPEGVLLLFPLGGGRYRLIADAGDEPRHDPALAEIQAMVSARAPLGLTLHDPVWLSSFVINERMVAQYRRGRVFLAGDAAHIHSPAGGQGMNTGMQDAMNLAWKLAMVERGMAANALLDSYSPERSAVARGVLSESGRLTRAALLRNPLAQGLRNFAAHHLLGLRAVQHAMGTKIAELSVAYPDSPLNRGEVAGAPRPGERIVAGAPFGAGDAPRFALLAAAGTEAQALLAAYAGLVEPIPRPPLKDGAIRLVRPDGHVMAAAGPAGWRVLRDALDALAPPPA